MNDLPGLDGAAVPQYDVIIGVSDGALSATEIIFINVTKIEEPPVFLNLPDDLSLAENDAGGYTVFTVSTYDADGDTVTYAMTSEPTGAPFTIDANSKYSGCLGKA